MRGYAHALMAEGQETGTPRVVDTPPEEMYLDLLKRVLTRMLFDTEIRPVDPQHRVLARLYRALRRRMLDRRGLSLVRERPLVVEHRQVGLDHPPDAETMVGIARLDNLQHCITTALEDEVPGDLLEAGVWRGGSAIFMKAVLAIHGVTDRRVWVCDSFAGLPRPDPTRFPADEGDMLWSLEHLAVGVEQVRRNFERYGLLDENVEFVEGLFQDTLATVPVERLAVLRADGDMYESTIAILEALYHKVSPGGFVIIDDFGAIPACRKAVEDFRDTAGVHDPIETIDWTGAYWRKSA